MNKVKAVTFFGFAGLQKSEPLWNEISRISEKLAEKGLEIVDGGGPGVMLAATEGAKTVPNSKTTAVYYRPNNSTMFEGAAASNIGNTQLYFTDYVERTLRLLQLGDIYFVFNGGTGTFSELGMAWGLARLYFGHHKPLILYGTFWHEVMDTICTNMRIREEEKKVFKIADNIEQALEMFDEYVKEIELREPFRASVDEAKFMV